MFQPSMVQVPPKQLQQQVRPGPTASRETRRSSWDHWGFWETKLEENHGVLNRFSIRKWDENLNPRRVVDSASSGMVMGMGQNNKGEMVYCSHAKPSWHVWDCFLPAYQVKSCCFQRNEVKNSDIRKGSREMGVNEQHLGLFTSCFTIFFQFSCFFHHFHAKNQDILDSFSILSINFQKCSAFFHHCHLIFSIPLVSSCSSLFHNDFQHFSKIRISPKQQHITIFRQSAVLDPPRFRSTGP